MDIKKHLKKMTKQDLRYICRELGIKILRKNSKKVLIKKLLKPFSKKYGMNFNKDIVKEIKRLNNSIKTLEKRNKTFNPFQNGFI